MSDDLHPEIRFSTRPLTIREWLLAQRGAQQPVDYGAATALFELMRRRLVDPTQAEALADVDAEHFAALCLRMSAAWQSGQDLAASVSDLINTVLKPRSVSDGDHGGRPA